MGVRDDVKVVDRVGDKVKKPRMYKVVVLNDDFTPFEFVARILQDIFRLSLEHANAKTDEVHKSGAAVVGVYTREIAETKIARAMADAEREEYPLQLIAEPE